ncbi:hypothetical protein DFJ63DRAFT_120656 [Scheffersomyces coipomensis]|uniref:uncharacterized protein n=1 Tax=Scheffersomyces coipomensis TaxID=1788519 RepID=UPI00315C5356
MQNFIDFNILAKSSRFVIDKLYNDANYNYFNNAETYEDWNNEWRKVKKDTIELSLLERNRTRLVFWSFNYHVISIQNPYKDFDIEYISGEYCQGDLTHLMKSAEYFFGGVDDDFRNVLREQHENESVHVLDLVRTGCINLFKISFWFSTPCPRLLPKPKSLTKEALANEPAEVLPNESAEDLPAKSSHKSGTFLKPLRRSTRLIAQRPKSPNISITSSKHKTSLPDSSPNKVSDQSSPKNTSSWVRDQSQSGPSYQYKFRSLFKDNLQIASDFQELDTHYFEMRYSSIMIDKALLEKFDSTEIKITKGSKTNEQELSYMLKDYLLNPILEFLIKSSSDSIILNSQSSTTGKVIPEFKFTKNGTFQIPVQIKFDRISETYNNHTDSKKSAWGEFCNQLLFQILTTKSRVAYAFDTNCVLFIHLDEEATAPRLINESFEIQLAFKCKLFEYSSSDFNIVALVLGSMIHNLSLVSEEGSKNVDMIMNKLQIDDSDRDLYRDWQINLMSQDFTTQFSNFQKSGNKYIKEEYPLVSIPNECYAAVENMRFDFPDLLEEDFIIHPREFRPKSKPGSGYFSQVRLVNYIKASSKVKSPLILKVYNPCDYIENGSIDRTEFYKIYSFIVSMFLTEVDSYMKLRNHEPTGIDSDRPPSDDSINYLPYLFQYGWCNFNTDSKLVGFYLLLEYIDDSNTVEDAVKYKEAFKALKKIHQDHNMIHGDIKRDNILYSESRKRVYLIDFGLSKRKNISQPDDKSMKRDLQKLSDAYPMVPSSEDFDDEIQESPTRKKKKLKS